MKRLPSGDFTGATTTLISSNNPGAFFDALANATLDYCDGQHADWAAVVGAAMHERAVELWQTDPNHAPLPTTMSSLARCHIKALTSLGRSSEALDFTGQYIAFYESWTTRRVSGPWRFCASRRYLSSPSQGPVDGFLSQHAGAA